MTTRRQSHLFTEVHVSRVRALRFLSGIYMKYVCCTALSLHKTFKLIYLIDLILALITTITLIPIA